MCVCCVGGCPIIIQHLLITKRPQQAWFYWHCQRFVFIDFRHHLQPINVIGHSLAHHSASIIYTKWMFPVQRASIDNIPDYLSIFIFTLLRYRNLFCQLRMWLGSNFEAMSLSISLLSLRSSWYGFVSDKSVVLQRKNGDTMLPRYGEWGETNEHSSRAEDEGECDKTNAQLFNISHTWFANDRFDCWSLHYYRVGHLIGLRCVPVYVRVCYRKWMRLGHLKRNVSAACDWLFSLWMIADENWNGNG